MTDSQFLNSLPIRLTAIRQSILELLLDNHLLSADDIILKLKAQEIKCDRVTVYRTLDYLFDKQVVSLHHFGNRQGVYEIKDHPHHHHMICLKCKTVSTTTECNIGFPEYIQDFKISYHHLDYYGLCAKCR